MTNQEYWAMFLLTVLTLFTIYNFIKGQINKLSIYLCNWYMYVELFNFHKNKDLDQFLIVVPQSPICFAFNCFIPQNLWFYIFVGSTTKKKYELLKKNFYSLRNLWRNVLNTMNLLLNLRWVRINYVNGYQN